MSLDKFTRVLEVTPGYAHEAMRVAVLGSILDSETYKSLDIPNRYAAVRDAWVARLTSLRDSGWEVLEKAEKPGKAFGYKASCPPFGATTVIRRHACGLRFCPWCWARRVVSPAYDRLKSTFFEDDVWDEDGTRLGKPKGWMLAWFVRTLKLKYRTAEGKTSALLERAKRDRMVELDDHWPDREGAYVLTTIGLAKSYALFQRRGFAVFPYDHDWVDCDLDDGDNEGELDFGVVDVTQRQHLVYPLHRVCRYPRSWINCHPVRLRMVMKAIRGRRMANWFGCLRNTKSGIGK